MCAHTVLMCWAVNVEHTDKNLCLQRVPILVGENKQVNFKIQVLKMSSMKKFKQRKWIEWWGGNGRWFLKGWAGRGSLGNGTWAETWVIIKKPCGESVPRRLSSKWKYLDARTSLTRLRNSKEGCCSLVRKGEGRGRWGQWGRQGPDSTFHGKERGFR